MTEAIDSAFTDRADIKMLINPPHEMAIYTILRAAIEELIKVNKNCLCISKLFFKYSILYLLLGETDYKCRRK